MGNKEEIIVEACECCCSGKHKELLSKSMLYKNMWTSHIAGRDGDLND